MRTRTLAVARHAFRYFGWRACEVCGSEAAPFMSVNFFMLLLGAVIFRYLAMRTRTAYRERVSRLFGRSVSRHTVVALLRQYPEHVVFFRMRLLPLAAVELFFDAAACAAFLAAILVFPPMKFSATDLLLLQRGSVGIVLVALLVDVLGLCRALFATWEIKPASPEAK